MPPAPSQPRLILLTLGAAGLLAPFGLRASGQDGHAPAPLWDPPSAAARQTPPAGAPPWGGATDFTARLPARPASFGKGSALDPPPEEASEERERMELKPAGPEPSPGADLDPAGLLVTTGSSLAVVLGLFFLVMWLVRGGRPAGAKTLPSEAWEVLGRGQLDKTPVRLVRCGSKLLLVAVGGEIKTLTEIEDPAEVARLSALCGATPPAESRDFRQVYEASRQGGKVRHA